MKIPYSQIETFVTAYHKGRIDQSTINNYEKHFQKPISEIITDFEKLLNIRKYNVTQMTITDLRKLLKRAEQLTPEEKQEYINANPNLPFNAILQLAQRKVSEFEQDKPNRRLRGDIQKIENDARLAKRAPISFADMEKRGIGKYDPQTNSFSTNDFFSMLSYENSHQKVLARIHHEFAEMPRDVHTMPEVGYESNYFHVSSDGKKITVTQSIKKPRLIIQAPMILDENNFEDILKLYKMLMHGHTLKQRPDIETECWLGILKRLRISAR